MQNFPEHFMYEFSCMELLNRGWKLFFCICLLLLLIIIIIIFVSLGFEVAFPTLGHDAQLDYTSHRLGLPGCANTRSFFPYI